MPAAIPDHTRAAILTDIRTGTKSRAQIARDHNVSPWTVGNIAKQAKIAEPFSRERTKNATQARQVDMAALRAATAHRLLRKANELLDQMDRPHLVWNIGGKDNVYTDHLMDRPPTGDLRNLMISAATALDKHLVLVKHDASDGLDQARSMLDALAAGLGAAYEQLHPDGN